MTTCSVGSTTGWPSSFPYIVALDFGAANEELVRVTANAAGTLTIVRAFGGTSATSHSTGAVVRHAYNAQDATDFRTHEQATTGVHGATGSVVGTTDSQTLTNKTITSPAISNPTVTGGGSLSGTFTGSPTFSGSVTLSGGGALTGTFTGSPTFSGTPNFTGTVQSTQSAAGNTSLGTIVSADTFDRFRLQAGGRMEWGPGNAARDSFLFRDGANQLALDNTLMRIYRSASTSAAFSALVTGDSTARWFADAAGKMSWGPGNATQDTFLYRSAAGALTTDGSFAAGTFTSTGITPASGWTNTAEIFRATCGVSYANITLNRSGSTITNPGGSSGNVTPDLQLLTGVPASWRPTTSPILFTAATGVNSGAGRINTDGTVDLTDWEPGQDIASGANMRLSWVVI